MIAIYITEVTKIRIKALRSLQLLEHNLFARVVLEKELNLVVRVVAVEYII